MARKTTKSKQKRLFGFKIHHFSAIALVAIAVGLTAFFVGEYLNSTHAAVVQRFPGDPNPLVSGKAYFGASNDNIPSYEASAGKSVALYRKYYGSWGASEASDLASLIKSNYTANRLVWASFKTDKWSTVGNGGSDSTLDNLLRTIDAAGHPVWLTFWHEPENDENTSNTGSAADYVKMQQRIRQRMTAVGTKNIALAPIYMCYWVNKDGAAKHDRWWPGSGVFDIYGFDCYQGAPGDDLLGVKWQAAYKDAEAKKMPFAVGEWGLKETQTTMFNDFWNWQFTPTKHDRVGISYWDTGANAFVNSAQNKAAFINVLKTDTRVMRVQDLGTTTGGGTPKTDPDTTAPKVTLGAPSNGVTVKATTTVSGTASDNIGVTGVTMRIDGKDVSTDTSSPYSFAVDTTKYANGAHSIVLRAADAAGNVGLSATVSVTVSNTTAGTGSTGGTGGSSGGSGSGSTTVTPPASGGGTTTVISADGNGQSKSAPIPVKGKVVVTPSTAGEPLTVEVDGNQVEGDTVNSSNLTNGTHTLSITEGGQTKQVMISVHNPWYRNVLNEVRTHQLQIAVGWIVLIAAGVGLWIVRTRDLLG